ncbi:MAG: ADP-ribosylglycohydrolase family protein [Armatimonadota bacterium]
MPSLDELTNLVRDEITQREEEGCEVGDALERYARILSAPEDERRRFLLALEEELAELEVADDFPYYEPSTLPEIRAARPDGPRKLEGAPTGEELADKILGAWLGRCAGCMLGKPVEGWPKEKMEKYLRHARAWPLDYYFPYDESAPEDARLREGAQPLTRGNIDRMRRDDDMDYPIIGLHVLETHGPEFTAEQMGEAWLSCFPYHLVYTAERVAYRNLVDGLKPPESARYLNPYREWIGAQIRADVFGWVTPGLPEKGAELAFRDAALSHVKNGIYGEMYMAAVLSAAVGGAGLEESIRIGLTEIPAESRLAEAVRDTIGWTSEDDWEATWRKIMDKYGHYHGVHTINNAALVLMGLLHGQGDFAKTCGIAVMGGLDTDCNGATAGSIMGAVLGAKALPEEWTDPLNDRIESFVLGFNDSSISNLAARTQAIAEKVVA